MDARVLLQAQFKQAHDMLLQITADLTQDTISANPPGARINPIGAIFAHAVLAEDWMVNALVLGRPQLSETQAQGTGVPAGPPIQTPEWAVQVHLNLPAFRKYAEAVFSGVADALANMSDADFDREIEAFGQRLPAGEFLGGMALYHLVGHAGEIAALKGIHGQQGLPF